MLGSYSYPLVDKSNKNSESTSNLYSGSSSPLVEGEDNSRENLTDKEPLDIVVPPGWRLETDLENGCQCYVNIISGAKENVEFARLVQANSLDVNMSSRVLSIFCHLSITVSPRLREGQTFVPLKAWEKGESFGNTSP
ncbi:hypothetical protein ACFE04_019822 [Oxalis oulophora]